MTAARRDDDDDRNTYLSPAEIALIHEVVMSLEVCSGCKRISECTGVFKPGEGLSVLCKECRADMGVV